MRSFQELAMPSIRVFLHLCLAACATALQGCATITGSEMQDIMINTVDRSGSPATDSECRVSNDKGNWLAKPPSHVSVGRSGEDLSIHCTAPGHEPGLVKVISRANGGMVGNVVFGGVVGALIDNSGAGYDYPNRVRVVMGATLVLDKRDEDLMAPDVAGPAAAPSAATAYRRQTTMDDLKDLLPPDR
jgi:hypothetical protein